LCLEEQYGTALVKRVIGLTARFIAGDTEGSVVFGICATGEYHRDKNDTRQNKHRFGMNPGMHGLHNHFRFPDPAKTDFSENVSLFFF
jgi:hypothetical protein